jgi:hypothetical protein
MKTTMDYFQVDQINDHELQKKKTGSIFLKSIIILIFFSTLMTSCSLFVRFPDDGSRRGRHSENQGQHNERHEKHGNRH